MRISLRLFVVFAILNALLAATVFSMYRMAHASDDATEAARKHLDSRMLAEELRRSSDDLTRMARTYVVTGDPSYKAHFNDILAIRNGHKPRPPSYDHAYWDIVTGYTARPPPGAGRAVPLLTLMREARLTPAEIEKLKEALDRSNQLAEMERRAFRALEGSVVTRFGDTVVASRPAAIFAVELLHSPAYHQAKAEIMAPINAFYQMLETRSERAIEKARADHTFYEHLAAVLIIAAIAFSLMMFFHLRTYLTVPLERLSRTAKRVEGGHYDERVYVKATDELGSLADSFNAMIGRMGQVITELERRSAIDGLTQIANRRRFDERLTAEWRRSERSQLPLSIIMIDIDRFKKFNDTAGHLAGDDCLRRVAGILADRVRREGDLVARYGGEEFAVILHATALDDAMAFAEEVRSSVAEKMRGLAAHGGSGNITISLGVACAVPTLEATPETLVDRADQALFRAKRRGRNRVEGEVAGTRKGKDSQSGNFGGRRD